MNIDYRILVMPRDEIRVNHVDSIISKHPYFKKFVGFDWKNDWKEIKNFLSENKIRVTFFRNKGKIGSWSSSLKYYLELKESDFDYGVLVEDDTIIPDNFKKIVINSIKKYQPTDFLRLHSRGTTNIIVIKKDAIDDFINTVRKKTIYTAKDIFHNTQTNIKASKIKVHRMKFKSNINGTEKICRNDRKFLSNIK